MRLIFLILLTFAVVRSSGQSDSLSDSARATRKSAIYSEARKASIMSAVVPGLGQIYNKKYWKVPIIYAAFAGLGYLAVTNHRDYVYYSKNLRAENDNDTSTKNETPYNTAGLLELKRSSENRRDLSAFGFLLVYALNIIDANVDAHLRTFDVSDQLSLNISPWMGFGKYAATGVQFKLIIR